MQDFKLDGDGPDVIEREEGDEDVATAEAADAEAAFSPFGLDLFGDTNKGKPSGPVSERFTFPPFTILDAKAGEWRERKRAWLAVGLTSGAGRTAQAYTQPKGDHEYFKRINSPSNGVSIFDPVLCELVYRWFAPEGGQVLDPFAGGSVRGIVAGCLGMAYWGCDLSAGQVEENERQRAEILPPPPAAAAAAPAHAEPLEITPIEEHGGHLVKRDDLYTVAGVSGGKVRTCWALAQGKPGLVTAGSRSSPQANIVAQIAKLLGIPCRVHTPQGELSPELEAARAAGAEVVQHKAGYNNVIVARAREDARARGWANIPFGMECAEAVWATSEQVANIPPETKRIVIPVGSGMSMAGLLTGLRRFNLHIPVLGVVVGADPEKRLDTYAPIDWRFMADLVASGSDYHAAAPASSLGGLGLDSHYEAKCLAHLEPGDLLWVVGIRQTEGPDREPEGPVAETPHSVRWVVGDSIERVPEAPRADLVFSCPPYGSLEKYSDHPADVSNMEHEAFLVAYREIIRLSVERLKPDRFACFVVGDYRDKAGYYTKFVHHTVEAFEAAGARLYNEAVLATPVGTAMLRVTKHFSAGRKMSKTHQNVLVFCKGDWKKAAAACVGGEG